MEREMNARRLNERLTFCGKSREEMVQAIRAAGVNCSESMLCQAMNKRTRPVFAVIRSMCDVISERWVRERVCALTEEVGRMLEDEGESAEGLDMLAPCAGIVTVLRNGVYIGSYDPEAHRMTDRRIH